MVAERIAAGEVIERPASVVKELVENSLDAGATEILIHLEDGGKSLIEIVDNGYGMSREDLALCVQRHATSKLSTLDDLESIMTLGFRGEALPSVAAVSELTIVSRAKAEDRELGSGVGETAGTHDGAGVDANITGPNATAPEAYELRVQGNPGDRIQPPEVTTFGHFNGSPHGTRIQARGLFSQIPARLKFLKSQGAEVAQVREWIERLALTHPHAGFKLLSDRRTVLDLRPQEETERVRAVLAGGEDYPVLTSAGEHGGIRVRVHWLQGLSSPQTRKLIQVVNRRAVRDRMLQQAILAPFRQALLPGQFPAVTLYLDVDPAILDVNVHPTKTELRFLEPGKVFRAIERQIDDLIAKHGASGYAPGPLRAGENGWALSPSYGAPSTAGGMGAVIGAGTSVETNAGYSYSRPMPQNGWDFRTNPLISLGQTADVHLPRVETDGTNHREDFSNVGISPTFGALPSSYSAVTPNSDPALSPSGSLADLSASRLAPDHPFAHGRFAGTLFNTYLLFEMGNELGLVDQHAAHERVRYERLRKRLVDRQAAPTPQALLIPEAVTILPEDRAKIEARLPWLEKLGFEAEVFGESAVLFRAVPPEWGNDSLRIRLKNLVERTLHAEVSDGAGAASTPSLVMDESLFESLASEACHSAIRAGDRLNLLEVQTILQELFACEHPWNCPHGRPTTVRIPRARFEEWFQRRV